MSRISAFILMMSRALVIRDRDWQQDNSKQPISHRAETVKRTVAVLRPVLDLTKTIIERELIHTQEIDPLAYVAPEIREQRKRYEEAVFASMPEHQREHFNRKRAQRQQYREQLDMVRSWITTGYALCEAIEQGTQATDDCQLQTPFVETTTGTIGQ